MNSWTINMLQKTLTKFLNAPRPVKRLVSVAYDFFAICMAYYLAFVMRLNTFSVAFSSAEWITITLTAIASILFFIRTGLYRAILRYLPPQAVITITLGILVSSIVMIAISFFSHSFLPRSVPAIYVFVALILVGIPRLLFRSILQLVIPKGHTNILVYGTGESAHQLVQQLHKSTQYRTIAFIDDNKKTQNNLIMGLKVVAPDKIPQLQKHHQISKILLALDKSNLQERARIVRLLEPMGMQVQTIPPVTDLVSGKAQINEFRDIQIEELLGREAVTPDKYLLEKNIRGQVVLVTGAGGSIGSEICRQIMNAEPDTLIFYERSEFNLYKINEEFNDKYQSTKTRLIPILGSTNNYSLLERTLKEFKVHTLFHAAAYKHVPLVENNIIEGINNNLFGTRNTAQASLAAKVENVVLISSDKAVRPTNIMGASKRLAEMYLQALAETKSTTRFSMVRFGNVLDSSGSVVPKFREQIKNGGPITVTHPEITRYFMTMSEAAQLVLQASSLAKGGDLFVLEMGEPVKILNLAYEMAFLSGRSIKNETNPNGDIEIKFTGLRAGEKLYEELLIGNNCEGTAHPRIMRAHEAHIPYAELEQLLEKLKVSLDNFNHKEVLNIIKQLSKDFLNIRELQDYLYSATHNKIIPFTKPNHS